MTKLTKKDYFKMVAGIIENSNIGNKAELQDFISHEIELLEKKAQAKISPKTEVENSKPKVEEIKEAKTEIKEEKPKIEEVKEEKIVIEETKKFNRDEVTDDQFFDDFFADEDDE